MAFSEEPFTCKFDTFPQNVFIVKRLNSSRVTDVAIHISTILCGMGINVFVEEGCIEEFNKKGIDFIKPWDREIKLDFIVEIGGDGTLLWVSQLFPTSLPPVVGISMGNLGYLNQFKCSEVEYILHKMCSSAFPISLRQRLSIEIFDHTDSKIHQYTAVNECVIDRGTSPFLTVLEVYYNSKFFTNVSADGLILATPSGSTAYSMSAGGPVVHPKVPCFLFTPICPHSLSFRPLIIPDTATLRIELSKQSNTTSWVAIDGRCRTEIQKGMYIYIKLSDYPFPIVLNPSKEHGLDPWLDSLTNSLNWNQRFEKFDDKDCYETSPLAPIEDKDDKSFNFSNTENVRLYTPVSNLDIESKHPKSEIIRCQRSFNSDIAFDSSTKISPSDLTSLLFNQPLTPLNSIKRYLKSSTSHKDSINYSLYTTNISQFFGIRSDFVKTFYSPKNPFLLNISKNHELNTLLTREKCTILDSTSRSLTHCEPSQNLSIDASGYESYDESGN